MEYKQFCPVAKASELLGERWTFLIIRELLMGGRRFNELQRGLAQISPTMLTKRLNELAANGLVVRKKIPGQKGHEYYLSSAGKELSPVIKALGIALSTAGHCSASAHFLFDLGGRFSNGSKLVTSPSLADKRTEL